jgi:hypothetical protein
MRSRLCRCERPQPERDADQVRFCGRCGELLHDDLAELLAALVRKVAKMGERLEQLAAMSEASPAVSPAPAKGNGRLVSAKELAARLGVSVDWVRQRKVELGARTLPRGHGEPVRPRLYFDLSVAEAAMRDLAPPEGRAIAPGGSGLVTAKELAARLGVSVDQR